MKGLAITNTGIEDITASEIRELTSSDTEKKDSCVVFEAREFEDFFRLCYKAQSVRKIMLLLADFKIKNLSDIKKQVQKINLDEWIDEKTAFVVRSKIINNKIDRQELEAETGGFILDKVKARVNLENPETTFFIFIEGNNCYFGVDFSGKDLGKRDYRIFTGAETLKPTVAYALLRIAGFNPGDVFLDPFCRYGTIPIEAALFAAGFPVNYFGRDKFLFLNLKKFSDYDFERFFENEDKKISPKQKTGITAADQSFQAIAAAKKNAKIAGIMKKISFSRKEPKWLDIKFKEKSVDKIVSFLPLKSRTMPKGKFEKINDELFYQAEYILKKEGVIALLLKDIEFAENSAKKYGFSVKEKRKIMQGKEEFTAVVFSPKPL